MTDRDNFEDHQEEAPYATAGNLKNGAKVTLWGLFVRVAGNDGFYVNTVDEQEILIRLKAPLPDALEGWYEVHGVAQGKSIVCDEYISFPAEMTKNIDVVGHKNLSKLLSALDDPWNIGDQD